MFSFSVLATNKNALMEIFETLSRFHQNILLKCGDYTVDAHSLIGVFSLDINKPIELITDKEPDRSFIEAMSKFVPAAVA